MLRTTDISRKTKRKLFDKFNQQMRYLKNTRIDGLRKISDLGSTTMRDRMFHTLNSFMQRSTGEAPDRKKFNREYPVLSRFLIRKAREGRRLTLKSILSISNEYLRRYHHVNLLNNKALVGLAVGKVLSDIPRIAKQLSG